MKKDNRDCSMPYPIYPPYQGMGMPMGYNPMMMPTSNVVNNIDGQLNNLEQQVNNLERRVSNLENMYNTNKYSSSNYQMM